MRQNFNRKSRNWLLVCLLKDRPPSLISNLVLEDVKDVMKHWRTTAQTQSDSEYRAAIEAGGI